MVLRHFVPQRKPNSQRRRFSVFQKKKTTHPSEPFLSRQSAPLKVFYSHQKTQSVFFFWRLSVFAANCSHGVVPRRSPNMEYSDFWAERHPCLFAWAVQGQLHPASQCLRGHGMGGRQRSNAKQDPGCISSPDVKTTWLRVELL